MLARRHPHRPPKNAVDVDVVGDHDGHHHHIHRHPKGAAEAHEHPDDLKRFFDEVAKALMGAEEILIVGPSTAKLQFVKYVHQHQRAMEPKIVGLETVDHPTDAQLVAYVKGYFQVPAPRVR